MLFIVISCLAYRHVVKGQFVEQFITHAVLVFMRYVNMNIEINLNREFKDYGNQNEVLQGIQINSEHILNISKQQAEKEFVLKLDDIKFVYKFDFIGNERSFAELQLRTKFNKILFVAYKGDYIVRDKTGIYISNKEKFESRYSMMEYEKAGIC